METGARVNTSRHISHLGMVVNTIGDKAVIYLIKQDECHVCHLRDFCGVDDDERSRFEVPLGNLAIGDQVSLEIKQSTGFMALFWAYLMPFALIMLILIGGSVMHLAEQWLGILALLILVPYFLGLSLFRKKLKENLDFQVKK